TNGDCNTSRCRNVLQFHDISGFSKFYHQLHRRDFGQQPVEFVEQPRRVHSPARLGGPQRARRYPHLVAVRQVLKGRGTASDAAHVQELRFHGAGAHRRNGNVPSLQLFTEAHSEGGHIRLASAVHRHPGRGAEGCDGRRVEDASPRRHIGNDQVRHRRHGPDVQIYHPGLDSGLRLPHPAQVTAAGVVDEDRHLRFLRRQFFLQGGKGHGIAQVQGKADRLHPHHLPGDLLQPVLPAGNEPAALNLREYVRQLAGKLPSQTGGRAGDDGRLHWALPLSALFRLRIVHALGVHPNALNDHRCLGLVVPVGGDLRDADGLLHVSGHLAEGGVLP
ncbi:MBL fold metallo-hydrolase, partial [Dysosmobacter welbionis]